MSKINNKNKKKYNNKKLHFIVFQTSKKPVNFSVSKWLVYMGVLFIMILITTISILLYRTYEKNVCLDNDIYKAQQEIETLKQDKLKVDVENSSLKDSLQDKEEEVANNHEGLKELQKSLQELKKMMGIEDTTITPMITNVAGASRGVSNLGFRDSYNYNDVRDNISEDVENIAFQEEIIRTKYEIDQLQTKLVEKKQYMADVPSNFPTSGRYTSYFGPRWGKFHRGLDIANYSGTLIYATGNGVVVESSYNRSYGYYILIRHKYGFQTRYAHLSKKLVSVGDEVNQGDLIGKMGNTGVSTGTHLHYEIIYYGRYIDPLSVEKYFEY